MGSVQTTTPKELTPLAKAAKLRGLSSSTVRAAHFRGELAVVKVGANERYAHWYIDLRELDRWIESRTVRVSGGSAAATR
jgi:hypothetical protein